MLCALQYWEVELAGSLVLLLISKGQHSVFNTSCAAFTVDSSQTPLIRFMNSPSRPKFHIFNMKKFQYWLTKCFFHIDWDDRVRFFILTMCSVALIGFSVLNQFFNHIRSTISMWCLVFFICSLLGMLAFVEGSLHLPIRHHCPSSFLCVCVCVVFAWFWPLKVFDLWG